MMISIIDRKRIEFVVNAEKGIFKKREKKNMKKIPKYEKYCHIYPYLSYWHIGLANINEFYESKIEDNYFHRASRSLLSTNRL